MFAMQIRTDIIRKRYNRIARMYSSMDTMVKKEWRQNLLLHASGNVLEVGIGTGANPPYVDVTGIDFSPNMLAYAKERLEILPSKLSIHLLQMDAQHLTFPDHSFDTVVSTCVFCSVPDPILGLREIHRVLKFSGQFLMIEHMLSDNPLLAGMLHVLNPLTVRISGVNVNRRTMENLTTANFHIQHISRLAWKDIVRKIIATPLPKED